MTVTTATNWSQIRCDWYKPVYVYVWKSGPERLSCHRCEESLHIAANKILWRTISHILRRMTVHESNTSWLCMNHVTGRSYLRLLWHASYRKTFILKKKKTIHTGMPYLRYDIHMTHIARHSYPQLLWHASWVWMHYVTCVNESCHKCALNICVYINI